MIYMQVKIHVIFYAIHPPFEHGDLQMFTPWVCLGFFPPVCPHFECVQFLGVLSLRHDWIHVSIITVGIQKYDISTEVLCYLYY